MTDTDIKMVAFNNGITAICMFMGIENDFLSIQNAVLLQSDEENQRINMNPMLRMSRKDTDIQVPMANVDLIYTPTEGIVTEYISVFIEESKEPETVETEDVSETKKTKKTKKVEVEV
jgi:hypothetical protein